LGNRKRACPDELFEEASAELYRKALTEGAAIAGCSVSQGFEESRQKTFAEFESFLSRVGHGLSVEQASDLDVIAFMQGQWLPGHKGNCRTRLGGDGEKIASASAVKGTLQQLAKSYSMMERRDECNPAKQESVRSYCEGYRNWLRGQGVREKRAKVFREGKVTDLIEYLEDLCSKSGGLRKCVLQMDITAVDYLWESWARGKECGELRVSEVDFEKGNAEPSWSKTLKNERSACIDLKGGGRGRFLESAAKLISLMEQTGHPIGMGNLFRPLNRRRDGFEETALSANALRKRIQLHLKEAGLYEGETLHSFRRSAVQSAAEVEGFNVAKLMELGRWKSYAAFRLYVEEIEEQFPRNR
jgi:integrase